MDSSDAIQIGILIVLLALSAYFSSAETALTTVSKIRMRNLAESGNKKAVLVLNVIEKQSEKMLSTILIGNNIVNISASALATTLAFKFGGYRYMVSIVTAVITVMILVFGEITPKTVARINSEKFALMYISSIRMFMVVLTPAIFIINGFSRIITRLMRIDINKKTSSITEDDLRTLVDVIHEDGVIESEEKEMIKNVFDLGDACVKDVMVPRVHVSFANVNNNYWELIDIFKADKFTRLPVYEDTTDNVIGTINMKDLLLFYDRESFNVRDILREAYFTHEYKNIAELLVEMRDASINIAIVLDEYGDTAGLVTLEDILEEIVGEIYDEYDESEEENYKKINDYEYVIEGSVSLDDLNDHLNIGLESKEYDSLGGYIIEKLDRHPEVGNEVITQSGIRLVVETLDKNRVETVHIYLPEEAADDKESEDSGASEEAVKESEKNQ